MFSAPTAVNLEITDVCNAQCRHCYNYWRRKNIHFHSLDRKKMDRLIDIFADSGVFHVVLSGGEPFANFDILEYAIGRLLKKNISVSCNSNLMLATEEKIKRLVDKGLDHILTSLNSYDPETNDYMVCHKGAFQKIIKGIKIAVKQGLRISVNMIVSQKNKEHLYRTGRLAHELGCQKIFGTRIVPPFPVRNVNESELYFSKEDALRTLDELIRIKEETGIMIGILVSYPLCLLGDLQRYKDFVGRGCPGQSGHFMSITASGETHACVHEEMSHGNIFEIGIHQAYSNMKEWYGKQYRYTGCEGCQYLDVCKSGCRMSAKAYFGKMNERDYLMTGKEQIKKPFNLVTDQKIYNYIDASGTFMAPKRLRFRREKDVYLVNIRWANTVTCPLDVGEFLLRQRDSSRRFTINDLGPMHRELLARLYCKDAVVADFSDYRDQRNKLGLGVDILNTT